MSKLNFKNKFLILVFVIVILIIIAILVYSVYKVGNKNGKVYEVSSNTVLFANDSNIIDTTSGGNVELKWDKKYYYVNGLNESYNLGDKPIIYEKSNDNIIIFGNNYQVLKDGNIIENKDKTVIDSLSKPLFYKLEDRVYLIIAKEIYNNEKSIYASNYLLVYLDTQGNASVLNDTMNIKTVNPMILLFGDYTFDIANEKLILNDKVIDLKLIIGSTNQYVAKEKKSDKITYNEEKLIDSYNKLIGDFSKYANNHDYAISANNQITNNNVVVNGSSSSAAEKENKTNIDKRVSLRGAIAYPNNIDITYMVTDPENKYQAVYLLVTGYFNNQLTTKKIILDKYNITTKITELEPNNEYSISLGYIEVITNDIGEKSLADNIEDVINIRTTKIDYNLKIDKISDGNVYYTFKMSNSYAFESGNIVLYVDGKSSGTHSYTYNSVISKEGYTNNFKLQMGRVYEIRVENNVYNGKNVDTIFKKKFSLSS